MQNIREHIFILNGKGYIRLIILDINMLNEKKNQFNFIYLKPNSRQKGNP